MPISGPWIPRRLLPVVALLTLGACGDRAAACRLAALAGPLSVMEGFARGEGITGAPAMVPERLVARLSGGPAVPADISRDSTGAWVVRVTPPAVDVPQPGYAVLVTDRTLAPLGILLQDGAVLPAQPELGRVEFGGFVLPLLGVRVDPGSVTGGRCPLFPDDVVAAP